MSNGTIIQQGRFTSDGTATVIELRSDVDWMVVENYTQMGSAGAGQVVRSTWRRGMADDTGIAELKTVTTNAIQASVYTSGGFTRIDTSENPLSAINATGTTITGATGVCACTDTTGLIAGDTVRLVNTVGAAQFGGIDFTIETIVANTSFTLSYAPVIVDSTTFSFYKVKWPPFLFYPRARYITSISQATSAVVVLTVTHGYTVGQVIKFNVPSEYGMTEIDGLQGTITAINTTNNSLTVDIDSSGFTAFAWPVTATAAAGVTPATIVPIGEGSTLVAAGGFDGSKVNEAYIGMTLAAGATSPAGVASDVIYWTAGKSLDVNNL